MSIWSSADPGGPEILALENDGNAANYRGEGKPDVHVDVATTGHHELIRLSLLRDEPGLVQMPLDIEVLLTHRAARLLMNRLTLALYGRD